MERSIYENRDLGIFIDWWHVLFCDLKSDGVKLLFDDGFTTTYEQAGYKDIFNAAVETGIFIFNVENEELVNGALLRAAVPNEGDNYCWSFKTKTTGAITGRIDDFNRFMDDLKYVRHHTGTEALTPPLPGKKVYKID